MVELRPYLDTHMSPPDEPKRPLPSADEINAYLELSAARTKKRLPLAFGTTGAPKAPARDRKLRVAAAPAAERAREVSPSAELAPDPAGSLKTEALKAEALKTESLKTESLKKPSGG